ncbi:MAG: hypothetical protein V7704_21060 [Aurantimonas endophytica]|jgi:hypothetical protein|uniref:Uncharacterized protein n=1 Tax=Aurantimonas endophytica TaxID=1522175 RepID=A0A7W6MMW8_9HYPH|nr:hypothetical protein [Aurantimonas endophytica]MBB4001295.1 hypothetical protein [Aurantimonas endophytica]MCO6403061.1 hypothetical protein [Aurantimonas endophytica]
MQTDNSKIEAPRKKPPLRPEDRHDPFESRSKSSANDDGWYDSFDH